MNTFQKILPSIALASIIWGQEQKVRPRDVPDAILSAASRAFPQAKLKGWEKEIKDGKTFYEVAIVDGSAKRQAIFSADGPLVEIEETVQPAGIPEPVRAAILKKYPKAIIHAAEKITRGKDVEYELTLKNALKKGVVLTPDGGIIKED